MSDNLALVSDNRAFGYSRTRKPFADDTKRRIPTLKRFTKRLIFGARAIGYGSCAAEGCNLQQRVVIIMSIIRSNRPSCRIEKSGRGRGGSIFFGCNLSLFCFFHFLCPRTPIHHQYLILLSEGVFRLGVYIFLGAICSCLFPPSNTTYCVLNMTSP